MLLYAILLPLNIAVSLICYATNPIVLMFCSEEGELPGVLSYWQTWDNSVNPSDIKDFVPKLLLFDWDRHYEEYWGTTPELAEVGRGRYFCRVIDDHFSLWERFQRYCCRVLWLTRNCAYGWGFWAFGRKIEANSVEIVRQIDDDHGKLTYARVMSEPKFRAPYIYKNDRDIIPGIVRWCVFFGWKIDYTSNRDEQAMIAGRIAVRFGKR